MLTVKFICLYPKDPTTDFLCPVFESLVGFENIIGITGDSRDDDFYEQMSQVINEDDNDVFIFLGHGCSTTLIGSGFDTLLDESDLSKISPRILILFACNSAQLIKRIKNKQGIGFGFIPSGKDDIMSSTQFHNLDLSVLTNDDWLYIKETYQRCWIRAVNSLPNLSDIMLLYIRLNFFFSKAITETLLNSKLGNRRLISDILFYVKKEMQIFT